MHDSRGFTLIELMVTIAVLAIVISIAAPSFSSMVRENRISAMTLELQGALQLARSEAVKRRDLVKLCPSNAGKTDCSGATDWSTGWLIKVGSNVMKIWDPVQGITITGPSAGIEFRSNGMITDTSAQTLAVSSSACSGQQKRTLTVSVTGSTNLTQGSC